MLPTFSLVLLSPLAGSVLRRGNRPLAKHQCPRENQKKKVHWVSQVPLAGSGTFAGSPNVNRRSALCELREDSEQQKFYEDLVDLKDRVSLESHGRGF